MRKVIISLAAASAALAIASPAAAQFYPQPQPYGGYGYGQGYGNNNYGQLRALQARVDRLQWQINRLDRRDRLGNRDADRLREEAARIEQKLRRSARFGLNPYEASQIEARLAQLEQRVQWAANTRGNGYGWNRQGYGNGYVDRDRDGRDDRTEGRRQGRGDRDDRNDD